MDRFLEITPLFSEERLLELRVAASDGVFAGAASGYVDRAPLRQIAEELAGFPRDVMDEIKLEVEQPMGGSACLSFYCFDGKGHVAVLATLTGEPWVDAGAEADRASFRLKFELGALREFAGQLKALALGETEVARLNARRQT